MEWILIFTDQFKICSSEISAAEEERREKEPAAHTANLFHFSSIQIKATNGLTMQHALKVRFTLKVLLKNKIVYNTVGGHASDISQHLLDDTLWRHFTAVHMHNCIFDVFSFTLYMYMYVFMYCITGKMAFYPGLFQIIFLEALIRVISSRFDRSVTVSTFWSAGKHCDIYTYINVNYVV